MPDGGKNGNLIVCLGMGRCVTDAVQPAAGCPPGHRSPKYVDCGKLAVTFVNPETGRAMRATVKDRGPADLSIEEEEAWRSMDTDRDRDRGFGSIDWEALWRTESPLSGPRKDMSPKELWDKRAATFGKRVNRRRDGEPRDRHDYVSLMLERIEVRPGWTVLDIGCGPGILAIPLARRAASVTALDVSSEMLSQLRSRADGLGLTNIRYVNSSWEEAFAGGGVGSHDVVIASRSLMSGHVREALSHIASAAREAAYITSPVVHLPLDWEACAATGRGDRRHPPYIYLYNMLFQMGIQANIEVLQPKVRVEFLSIEEAVDDLQCRTDTFSPDEKARLRDFLKGRLAVRGDPPVFTHEGRSRWALIWWRTADQ